MLFYKGYKKEKVEEMARQNRLSVSSESVPNSILLIGDGEVKASFCKKGKKYILTSVSMELLERDDILEECPKCGCSDIRAENAEQNGECLDREIICQECDYSWTEVYRFEENECE